MKNGDNAKCWWGCGETEPLVHCWCEYKTVETFPLKTKNGLVTQQLPSWAFPPETRNTYFHAAICTWIFIAALFVIAKTPEAMRMCWMVKVIPVHPYHAILLTSKKGRTDAHNNLDEPEGNYAEWKKPIPKDYKLYDLTDMFWKGRILEMKNRV